MERKEALDSSFILDTSVVIKWFSQEEDTKKALNARERFLKGEIEITVPDLQLYEIANVLRYNKKLKESEIVDAVYSLMDIGINIIVPTKNVMALAIQFALKFDITLYDAYFIALADTLKHTFVTADQKLYQKIEGLKFARPLKELE